MLLNNATLTSLKKCSYRKLLFLFWLPILSIYGNCESDTNSIWDSVPVNETRFREENTMIGGLKLFESSIGDVTKVFGGSGTTFSNGESSPKEICYVVKNEKSPYIISFYFGASGGWEKLTGFSLCLMSGKRKCIKNDTCNSTLIDSSFATLGGLRLGLGINEIKRLFDKAAFRQASDSLLYHFSYVVENNSKGSGAIYDPSKSKQFIRQIFADYFIEFVFKKNVLVRFSIRGTMSN